MRYLILFVLVMGCHFSVDAQDIDFARKVINDLCSPQMAGRGYVKQGQQKAAEYIKNEFVKHNLLSFKNNFFQPFGFQAICFPNRVELAIDKVELIAGEDFVVSAGCPNVNGVFNIFTVDSATLDNPDLLKDFEKVAFYKTFLIVDKLKGKKIVNQALADKVLKNEYKAKGLIFANQEKHTWSVSLEWEKYPVIYLLKGVVKNIPLSMNIIIESEANDYSVNNVIGYIKGTTYPDSFIVLSAHFDHLGMLGNYAMFPGANDNASGIAMVLDLMHHIKLKPLPYSVVFMAFAAEEAGLLGSLYFTESPLFPLSQISLLVNLDLMGTGDKGMTVVNATLFPKEFQQLQLINITNNYLLTVNPRGKAANSDHHYFTEKGVKSFYFYLMGEYKFYHDVFDSPKAITLSSYNQTFSLIFAFIKEYSTVP
jgi:aminopeptidase YwaD